MLLPNGAQARIDDRKLLQYILSPTHPHGRSHARLFDQLLGINLSNAHVLRDALLEAATTREAVPIETSQFGRKYEVRFSLHSARGEYTVLSIWIVSFDDSAPKLVTAYIE